MQAAIDEIGTQDSPLVASENPAPDALPDPYLTPEHAQPELDPVAFMDTVFDYQMQVMAAIAEPPAPEQPEPSMPLEQIVEQEFQQMIDPAGMMAPPDSMDPGMPMDPFGPMEPEMGPM